MQIYHSKDFINWEWLTAVLKGDEVELRDTNTPAGIWAPLNDKEEKITLSILQAKLTALQNCLIYR